MHELLYETNATGKE
jgi:hypothetical protein